MDKVRILIVSEYRMVRAGLARTLASQAKFEVVGEIDPSRLIPEEQLGALLDAVVLAEISALSANRLPGITQLLQRQPRPRVVILTNNENCTYMRSLLAAGVLGYVLKRAEETELFLALERARQGQRYLDPRLSDSLADLVLGDGKNGRHSELRKLSRRETQILHAVAQGFTSLEIAGQFGLSVKTVGTYRSRIYEKLALKTRADLV